MSHLQEVRLEELNPVLDVRQQEKSQKKKKHVAAL